MSQYQAQYPNYPQSNNNVAQGSYLPQPPYYVPTEQVYPPVYPVLPVQQPTESNGKAVAGLVLGIISMIAWIIPLIGLPTSIIGMILASKARQTFYRRGMATIGLVLCIIALVLALINAVAGAAMVMH